MADIIVLGKRKTLNGDTELDSIAFRKLSRDEAEAIITASRKMRYTIFVEFDEDGE